MMKVSFVTHTVFHYRRKFHEAVRQRLGRDGVDYDVFYGQPDRSEATKADTVELSFGEKFRNRYIYAHQPPLIYQPVLRKLVRSDLAIVIQENRLLTNYVLQSLPSSVRPRIALFGHGRNFQARNPDGRIEQWKRRWATRCDWWFGYTGQSREHLVALGFPENRITVFNNAIDTGTLRSELESATAERVEARRKQLGLSGGAVGLFVGGLYADKRLDFLIDAAIRVHRQVPEFELVIVGAGPAEAELRAVAAPHPWIKVTGPQFGQAKAEIMRLADLFLMPGLVGLAVLDAGVAGLPLVTTAYPYHSPEIAYLKDRETGVIVREWESAETFAGAVAALLQDRDRLTRMADASRNAAAGYTVEAMAERFADGVIRCLAAEKLSRACAHDQAA